MQMVCPLRRVRFAEPQHLVRPIRRIDVAEPSERLDGGARGFEVVDTDEDVDNGFSIQTGHRRTADMMYAAGDQVAKRLREDSALFLEAHRPALVIRVDANRFVAHHESG